MNKKYVMGAVVICAAAAGWFGMYTVEKTTETAVADALSAVPAKAGEIKYSFLQNTLTLKGVEFDITDTTITRKGRIDNVEVKGFNRKYVFSRSDAPYNPDTLPVVAESITATGISDTMTMNEVTMEQKVEKVQLTGWHQRLGTLLSLRRDHMGEASFFEELYRCRIDGMEISNVTMKLSDPDISGVVFSVEKMALPEGVRAPRGTDKVSPVTVSFSGIRFDAEKDIFGSLQKLELRDVLLPAPEVVAEFFQLSKKLNAVDGEELYGSEADKLFTDLFLIMQKNYEKQVPVGRILLEKGSISLRDDPEDEGAAPSVLTMDMKSFDYLMSMTEAGAFKNTTTLSGVKFAFPESMEEADILNRYAPDGLVLNAKSESLTSDKEASGKVRYELEGLGELEGDMALEGDIRTFLDSITYEVDPGQREALMNNLRMKSMNLTYRDSGLMAMSVEIASRWNNCSIEESMAFMESSLQELARMRERPLRELGNGLLEQMAHPGEFRMTIAPEKPMNVMEAALVASLNPDALPVTFSSKPGTKALTDYLPKK